VVILPARQGYLEGGQSWPSFFLMSDDPSIAPDDGRIIQSLLQALETFLKLRGPIPLRELVIFLHIALDEGEEAIEYADRLKLHRGAVSKYVHDLADRARNGGPGLGLVEFRYTGGNKHNRKPIFLTRKGRSVAAAILKSLRNPYAPLA
jgi:DNA-binding MarR family transcriptional regulator